MLKNDVKLPMYIVKSTRAAFPSAKFRDKLSIRYSQAHLEHEILLGLRQEAVF